MDRKIKYLPSAMLFFTFGFFYYIVTPLVSVYFLENNKYVEIAQGYLGSSLYTEYYLPIAFVGYISFYLFYKIGGGCKFTSFSFGERISGYKTAPILVAMLLTIILIASTIKGLASGVVLFSGYSSYNVDILGPYATVVFCSVLFMNFFDNKITKKIFIGVFIISSLLLIGLGSRMFFVLGLISIILNSVARNPRMIKTPLFIFSLSIILLFVLSVGIWRSNGDFSVDEMLGVFIAEPLFTSISSAIYLNQVDDFFVFKAPMDILAAIINFAPSLIVTNKSELLNVVGYDIKSYSPFGASSLLVNVHINFGVLFFVYFSFIGFIFGLLRKLAYKNNFAYAVYLSSLPLLMFHFYREGFVTYLKVQFYNAIILPFLVLFVLGFLLRRRNNIKN